MKRYLILAAVLCTLTSGIACGNVRLPALVGNGMVLQRDAKVAVWGWADPAERIRISIDTRTVTAVTNRIGEWFAVIGPFSAGGPYEMTVSGKNIVELHDVFVGDVWLASGQSNMEFPLKGSGEWKVSVKNAEQEISAADFPQIRLFKMHPKVAFKPTREVDADAWVAVTPQTVGDFSAVAYLFGRELHQRYKVPTGLIETAVGGTVAEAWVSAKGLTAFPEFRESIDIVARANEKAAVVENDRYMKEKAVWDHEHAFEDRGQVQGRAVWADPALDVSAWPKIIEPQRKPNEALKGFDGAVWFRRGITIPENQAGKDLRIHLTSADRTDVTYFNGEKVGETDGWDTPRDYEVPGKLVKAGCNVIAIRLTGSHGYVGLNDFDYPDKQFVETGGATIPLASPWSYRPGPDLSGLPPPSVISKLSNDPNRATVLFNSMINPLTPFRIKGVIWYQGEANALDNRSAQYRTLFPVLIEDWRRHWGYEVPFLFVQLAGFGHNKAQPSESSWADLREAQSMALSLPATGMASAVDMGDENDIHPRNKQDVAHRLVLAAASVAYGETLVHSGPTYQLMRVEGNQIRLKFSNLGSGLLVKDKYGYVRGFQLAGADGKFTWAQARQDDQDIVVSSGSVQQPAAVRYAWSNTPDGDLYNTDGLPAIPFRTDGYLNAPAKPK